MRECEWHRRLGPNPEDDKRWRERQERAVEELIKAVKAKENQMGDFRVVVEGIGGHGCGRGTGGGTRPGAVVDRCNSPSCPDCQAIEFVKKLKASGTNVDVARIEHWPVPGAAKTWRQANPGPIDNLLDGTRDRSF